MILKKHGFTLVELVLVVIILGILGTATTSYIATGVKLYAGISERDRELGSIRFAMERLRRDILNALPNSLVVTDIGSDMNACLTFTPIIGSTVYGFDFPIAPVSDVSGDIASIDNYTFSAGDQAVVYLLDETELTSNAGYVQSISAIDEANESISFASAISFPLDSPSKRLYIINGTKSYYFSGSELILADACGATGSIMADDIEGEFNVSGATLQRNGLATVTFNLDFDGQEVPIEQTLHVSNVP